MTSNEMLNHANYLENLQTKEGVDDVAIRGLVLYLRKGDLPSAKTLWAINRVRLSQHHKIHRELTSLFGTGL